MVLQAVPVEVGGLRYVMTGGREVRKGWSVGFTGDVGRENGSSSLCPVSLD